MNAILTSCWLSMVSLSLSPALSIVISTQQEISVSLSNIFAKPKIPSFPSPLPLGKSLLMILQTYSTLLVALKMPLASASLALLPRWWKTVTVRH